MRENALRAIKIILSLALVVSVFCLRRAAQPEKMEIPVTQVFSYVPRATALPSPLEEYHLQREKTRAEDIAALTKLAENGDIAAKEYMLAAISRHEKETAVEGALAAAGYAKAVCAVRDGAVTICVSERLDTASAQSILEICQIITQECPENVFLLDESGYSW